MLAVFLANNVTPTSAHLPTWHSLAASHGRCRTARPSPALQRRRPLADI